MTEKQEQQQSSITETPTLLHITRNEDQDAPLPEVLPARRQGQHMTDEEKATAQATFLEVFSQIANVTAAAKHAGVHPTTIYDWIKNDADFAEKYEAADHMADDVLIREAWRRGVEGYTEPIVSLGKLVIGPDGKPMMVRKYSDNLLMLLMRARMPQFREKSQVDVNATATVNQIGMSAHQITIDPRGMSQERLNQLREIALEMKGATQH